MVENSSGEIELADTAEACLIEEGRQFNREALQSWADNQVKIRGDRFKNCHKQVRKDTKKNSIGTQRSEKSK